MTTEQVSKERKGWFIKQSFNDDFVALMEGLKEKYGEEVFRIQGIASGNLDLAKFSKEFFKSATNSSVADISIDGNANVAEKNITQYNHEANKALMKLNSLYLLYKWIKKIFTKKDADAAIEKIVSGEVFVNDLVHASMPYSYHSQTSVMVKIDGGSPVAVSMSHLFELFSSYAVRAQNCETVTFDDMEIKAGACEFSLSKKKAIDKSDMITVKKTQNIDLLDADGNWVKLQRVLRHHHDRDFVVYVTNKGNFAIVTDDHPVTLADRKDKAAANLELGDKLLSVTGADNTILFERFLHGEILVDGDWAFFIGYLIGCACQIGLQSGAPEIFIHDMNSICLKQDQIAHHPISKTIEKLFPNDMRPIGDSRIEIASAKLLPWLSEKFALDNLMKPNMQSLPANVLSWTKSSIMRLIEGIYQSHGEGHIIKTKSLALVNQLDSVAKIIGVRVRKSIEKTGNGIMFVVEESKDEVVIADEIVSDVTILSTKEMISTFGKEIADHVYDVTTSSGRFYANGMSQHNCYAFDLRNLMSEGMKFFHGNMTIHPPKRADSFIALIIQSTAYISNQIVGAASFPDFFVALDYFYRKELGSDYAARLFTDDSLWRHVKNQFQNLIFSANFPFRGNESAFTNLSVMDRGFLKQLFGDYVYPDTSKPDLESTLLLSKKFFEYYCSINGDEGIFTFPVMTLAISLDDKGEYIDPDFVEWAADVNCGKAMANIYQSVPNSFSSCCRLRNQFDKVADIGYQNSFGVGGLSIGSHRVAGLNLPRIALLEKDDKYALQKSLTLIHKILYAHRQLIKDKIARHAMPLYDAGWIDLHRQYSTVGFVGAHEYIVNKGLDITSQEGLDMLKSVLMKIEENVVKWQEGEKKEKTAYNIEQIPAESMAVRLAEIDTILGYNEKGWKLYSNQYIPLTCDASIYDRFRIQGSIDSITSGGAILHLNVDDEKPLTKVQFKRIMEFARKTKTVYFAVNYAYSECGEKHLSIGKRDKCPVCSEKIVCQYTRVVGFITPVKSWNKVRKGFEYGQRVFYANDRVIHDIVNPSVSRSDIVSMKK